MANWQANGSRRIIRRLIANGTLILDSPAHFGNGEQEGSELIILEDRLAKRPLIPGASLAGALRQYLLSREAGYRASEKSSHIAVQLFGTALDESETGIQSRVMVDDALGTGKLQIRDGVKIDAETRSAEDGALYALQVWEAGTKFQLSFELQLYENDNLELYETAFAMALLALGSGEIRMGARKHRGYGRCHVDDWHLNVYDMSNKAALVQWLRNKPLDNRTEEYRQKATAFMDNRKSVEVDAFFSLCDSILIRESSDVAEASHLSSNGKRLLSGTAIAGALRARALKILKTIQHPQPQALLDDLFGKHGDSDDTNPLTASRIIIDEYPIEHGEFNYIQNRVKIDRFTSGAFETALFDEQPLFATEQTKVRVRMTLLYPHNPNEDAKLAAQTGLILLLLKDLATEDLPLGGESSIGRGRLHGEEATITIKSVEKQRETIQIKNNRIQAENIQRLQGYVDSLWKGL